MSLAKEFLISQSAGYLMPGEALNAETEMGSPNEEETCAHRLELRNLNRWKVEDPKRLTDIPSLLREVGPRGHPLGVEVGVEDLLGHLVRHFPKKGPARSAPGLPE